MKLLLGLGVAVFSLSVWAESPASVTQGSYECWVLNKPRTLLNFKVTGADSYTDIYGDERGNFIYNPQTGAISFKGGHLEGAVPETFTPIYHLDKTTNRPTLSYMRHGAEATICRLLEK